jgi:serine/threonine protein kinase
VIYCHFVGIVHRDLKPENLLLTDSDLKKARLKLCDFRLSRLVGDDNAEDTICGAPSYMAPEVLFKMPFDERCDYWSLGVILFLLLSG